MRRYTETNKWRDPWFRALSGQAKLLWIYALDHADDIGTFSFNLRLAEQDLNIGLTQSHFDELRTRLQKLRDDKFHIPKFVHFHLGTLNSNSTWVRRIKKILEDRNLVENEWHEWHYPQAPAIKEKAKADDDSTPKQRARNPLMDALAIHAEDSDPLQVTGSKWKSIGTALATIQAACKKTDIALTAEEIARRAENYRSQFHNATITANALAQHWARCDNPGGNHAPQRRRKSPDGEVPHPENPPVPFDQEQFGTTQPDEDEDPIL